MANPFWSYARDATRPRSEGVPSKLPDEGELPSEEFAWPRPTSGDDRSPIAADITIPFVRAKALAFQAIYETQPWVFAAANLIARSIAMLPWHVYTLDADRVKHPVRNSELLQRLEEPTTPGGDYNGFGLKEHIGLSLAVHGNATAGIVPSASGAPREIWPALWQEIEVIPGNVRPVAGYLWKSGAGVPRRFRPDEMLHLRWGSQSSYQVGTSPLQPLARTLRIDEAALRMVEAAMRSIGLLGGYLTRPITSPQGGASGPRTTAPLDPAAQRRIQRQVERMYAGPDNAYRIPFFDGFELKRAGQSVTESGALAVREFTREEVALVYGIPPPMLGILDHATFSNVTQQHIMLYSDTLGPWLKLIEEGVTAQLVSHVPEWAGQRVGLDTTERIRGTYLEQVRALVMQAGWMTPNEQRATLNLPALDDEEADRIHVPLNTTTALAERDARGDSDSSEERE